MDYTYYINLEQLANDVIKGFFHVFLRPAYEEKITTY